MLSNYVMQTIVVDEVTTLLEKTQVEKAIPPAFTIAHIAAYSIASLVAILESEGKKPSKALKEFYSKTYPKILKDLDNTITKQHLLLNTEGNC